MVAKAPKFFVIQVDANYLALVTIDYHLNVIDAIHIAAGDSSNNDNYKGELTSTIYKNLKITMHYAYIARSDEEGHFNTTKEDNTRRIDNNGHFKPVRHVKPD